MFFSGTLWLSPPSQWVQSEVQCVPQCPSLSRLPSQNTTQPPRSLTHKYLKDFISSNIFYGILPSKMLLTSKIRNLEIISPRMYVYVWFKSIGWNDINQFIIKSISYLLLILYLDQKWIQIFLESIQTVHSQALLSLSRTFLVFRTCNL